MKKIIIVEGIDKVGKSILCQTIKDKLQCCTFSENRDNIDFSHLKAGQVTKQQHLLLNKLCFDKTYLFDRFHISEAVYGFLRRNYDKETNLKLFDSIDKRLANMCALLIYVKPTSLALSEKEHGSPLYKDLTLFDEFVALSRLPKIICNYNSFSNPELYEQILFEVGGTINDFCITI